MKVAARMAVFNRKVSESSTIEFQLGYQQDARNSKEANVRT